MIRALVARKPRRVEFGRRFAALGVAIAVFVQSSVGGHTASTSNEKPAVVAKADDAAPQKQLAPVSSQSGSALYRMLAETEAKRAGIPGAVAEAVMAVESGFNPNAIGTSGEIGLMQILPSTARMLGFVGSNSDLAQPETNVHYGVTYLAQAWQLAGHDICTTAMKYRAGHGETRFSYRSVDYCLAIRAKLTAQGFPVTGNVPIATFGESGGCAPGSCLAGGARRFNLGSPTVANLDLLALNSRINQIVINVNVRKLPVP